MEHARMGVGPHGWTSSSRVYGIQQIKRREPPATSTSSSERIKRRSSTLAAARRPRCSFIDMLKSIHCSPSRALSRDEGKLSYSISGRRAHDRSWHFAGVQREAKRSPFSLLKISGCTQPGSLRRWDRQASGHRALGDTKLAERTPAESVARLPKGLDYESTQLSFYRCRDCGFCARNACPRQENRLIGLKS